MIDRREFLQLPPKLATLSLGLSAAVLSATAALAQVNLEYYFPETGHHLSGDFLNFWRRNWNGHIFGEPITEEITDKEGWRSQWFENARMEQDPEDGHVQLGALSNELFKREGIPIYDMNSETLTLFGRRFPTDLGLSLGESFFDPMGGTVYHTERMAFRFRGLSTTATERSLSYQKRYRFLDFKNFWPGDMEPKHLGLLIADKLEVDTKRVEPRENATIYTPSLLDGFKRIDVNLTEQVLIASEGNFPVFIEPVSTGKIGAETPAKEFRVLSKEELIDYQGWDRTRYYNLPDVPYNLRFYPETYIHGTYWHDAYGKTKNFGVSLGCVNLDPYNAAWLYNWARVGTPVNVHY